MGKGEWVGLDWDLIMCKEKSRSQGVGWGARRKEGKKEEKKGRVNQYQKGEEK